VTLFSSPLELLKAGRITDKRTVTHGEADRHIFSRLLCQHERNCLHYLTAVYIYIYIKREREYIHNRILLPGLCDEILSRFNQKFTRAQKTLHITMNMNPNPRAKRLIQSFSVYFSNAFISSLLYLIGLDGHVNLLAERLKWIYPAQYYAVISVI
jgi:hypothetical protein